MEQTKLQFLVVVLVTIYGGTMHGGRTHGVRRGVYFSVCILGKEKL